MTSLYRRDIKNTPAVLVLWLSLDEMARKIKRILNAKLVLHIYKRIYFFFSLSIWLFFCFFKSTANSGFYLSDDLYEYLQLPFSLSSVSVSSLRSTETKLNCVPFIPWTVRSSFRMSSLDKWPGQGPWGWGSFFDFHPQTWKIFIDVSLLLNFMSYFLYR